MTDLVGQKPYKQSVLDLMVSVLPSPIQNWLLFFFFLNHVISFNSAYQQAFMECVGGPISL